jgi:hypothetical protein
MAIITKNFQLNSLANQYAAALYNTVIQGNGECFYVMAGGTQVRVNIVDGVAGMRMLVDGYALEPLRDSYRQWEPVAIALLGRCVAGGELTALGRDIWQSMVSDMGATVASNGGVFNA